MVRIAESQHRCMEDEKDYGASGTPKMREDIDHHLPHIPQVMSCNYRI